MLTAELLDSSRVNRLRDGSRPILNGTSVKLKASGSDRTVFDDGHKDMLQGDAGLDWFFADFDGIGGDDDKIKDNTSAELRDMIHDGP